MRSDKDSARRSFRVLKPYLKEQRRTGLIGAFFLAIEAGSAILEALPIANILAFLGNRQPPIGQTRWAQALGYSPIISDRYDTIIFHCLTLILAFAVNSAADSLASIYLSQGGKRLGYRLRVGLYGHLQKLSLAYHNQRRTGDVVTRLTGDITAVEDFVTESSSDLIGGVFLLVAAVIALFGLNWRIALLGIVLVPSLAFISEFFSKRIKKASKQQRASEGDLASAAQEMLTAIRVVQTYGRAGLEQQRFAEQSGASLGASLQVAGLEARFSFFIKLSQALITVAVIALSVYLIDTATGAFSFASLFYATQVIDKAFKPTRKIIKQWSSIGKLVASVERIAEIFERKPTVFDLPSAVSLPETRGEIEFRRVSFAYEPDAGPEAAGNGHLGGHKVLRLALHDVNFTLRPGEVLALVGRSGAGKSTVAQLLPRLYDPQAGQVLIDGYDLRQVTITSLRDQLSMVLQETLLFTGTVAENIAYGRPGATREEIIEAAKQANAHTFIKKMKDGYDAALGERAANLSGGQRQRIAIARAFVRNTRILVLDEPTTGLDAESTDLVLEALTTLMRGKTTVIVSHDLNLVRHADTILVMNEGRVVQRGSHEELLRREGLYSELYERQFGAGAATPGEPPAAPEPDFGRPLEPDAFADQGFFPAMMGGTESSRFDDDDDDERQYMPEPDDEPEPPSVFSTLLTQAIPQPLSEGEFAQFLRATQQEQPQESGAGESIYRTGVLRVLPRAPAKDGPDPASGAGAYPLLESPVLAQELPGLAAALDPARAADLVGQLLRPGWQVVGCRPGKAVYEPGEGATLRYGLTLTAEDEPDTDYLLLARAFGDVAAARRCLDEVLTPLAETAAGRDELAPFARPAALLEPLAVAVSPFPIDPDLPALIPATDPWGMRDLLRKTVPSGELIDGVGADVLAYARRGRCVLRYELRSDRAASLPVVFGKLSAEGLGESLGAVTAALAKILAPVAVPNSLGYDPSLKLALYEPVSGTAAIARLLRDPSGRAPSLPEALDAAAWIAGRLHTSELSLGRTRSLDDDLAELLAALPQVRRVTPDLALLLDRWIGRAEALATAVEPQPPRFTHGDFTHSQLLFEGSSAGLIDFDSCYQAEPARDLGRFTAYLRAAAYKAHQPPELFRSWRERFLDSYRLQVTDGEQAVARTGVYELVSLLQSGLSSWHKLKPDRIDRILEVIDSEPDAWRQPDRTA